MDEGMGCGCEVWRAWWSGVCGLIGIYEVVERRARSDEMRTRKKVGRGAIWEARKSEDVT